MTVFIHRFTNPPAEINLQQGGLEHFFTTSKYPVLHIYLRRRHAGINSINNTNTLKLAGQATIL